MRVLALALVTGLFALSACASGFDRNEDDDNGNDPRIDAPFTSNGDGGFTIDAPSSGIDAPGSVIDAPTSSIDAPTTGGINCPDTIDYYIKALDEISGNPNWVDCTSGADCTISQCCYGMIVCVAYP
jgi:hypothetical protein